MNGVLVLNKPKGLTSHDCVFKIRKILKTKKVGHTGTLDPEVTGVLPICIGNATKLVEFLTAEKKTYIADITIGFSTTTEDQTGETVEKNEISEVIKVANIQDVLTKLTGEIKQTPPMYSAVKVNGKKLYEYARAGVEVERPTRTVTIHEIKLLQAEELYEPQDTITFTIQVTCSKGTYVRTLAVAIGELLGYPAHMSKLQRTASGKFSLEESITLEKLQQLSEENRVNEILIPMENALSGLPTLEINDTLAEKVLNGALLPLPEIPFDELLAVMHNHKCIAIYMKHPTKKGLMKPKKVFN
ncbi:MULTISPECIES: tRNA pseudouridine(55) synthase TruB [Bacillus]|uniref:tRNA pseudouridine(55) synthase TruB n=1 Tax=Bacillus TaxID=1386 RepID=UPI000BB8D8D7|nr:MULTISPECIES: tRNA pseudouridine(55) synthase TruB [Bacillus]